MQRSGRDGVAVQRIKSSYWQLMIAGILNLIPVFGNLMAHLLCIVAMLQQVRGYYTLSHSAVLSEVGRQGAKRLFVAALGMSLAAVIGLFSLYGNFIQATVGLSFLFVILSGWKMIGQGAYALTEEEVTEWNRRVCLSSETRFSVVVVVIILLLERGWHILFCKFTLYDYGFHTVDLLSWVVSSLLVWNLLIFTNMRWNDWGRVGGGFFLFSLFADIVLYLSLDLFSGVDFETDFYVFYIHSVVDMLQSVQLCLVIAGTLLWGYCCMPIKNNKKSRLPLIE